jgi:hypothetical protein
VPGPGADVRLASIVPKPGDVGSGTDTPSCCARCASRASNQRFCATIQLVPTSRAAAKCGRSKTMRNRAGSPASTSTAATRLMPSTIEPSATSWPRATSHV